MLGRFDAARSRSFEVRRAGPRARLGDDALGVRPIAVAARLDLGFLEVLVDLEEVLDLVPQLRGDVVNVARCASRLGSFSGTQMIFSSGPFSSAMWNTADDATANPAAGEGRLADEHERIERIAVAAQRSLDEAVVRRIRHRGEETPVEDDRSELVVELVLVPRPGRNLDEDGDGLGRHRLRLLQLDGGERCESLARDGQVDVGGNGVVTRDKSSRIQRQCAQRVRL